MKKKLVPLLLIPLLIFSVVMMSLVTAPTPPSTATIGVEPTSVTGVAPGSFFTVEIWIRGVTNLAGIGFKLGYDTTVLTAIHPKWAQCDFDDDGDVDSDDFYTFAQDYGETSPSEPDCDLNGDGVVDSTDLHILEMNYHYPPKNHTQNGYYGPIEYGGIFGATPDYFPLINVLDDAEGMAGYSIMEMFMQPPFTGDGKAAIITFLVDSVGSCTLDLYGTSLGDQFGMPIAHTVIDGYFDNT